jgi:hypothetical protein
MRHDTNGLMYEAASQRGGHREYNSKQSRIGHVQIAYTRPSIARPATCNCLEDSFRFREASFHRTCDFFTDIIACLRGARDRSFKLTKCQDGRLSRVPQTVVCPAKPVGCTTFSLHGSPLLPCRVRGEWKRQPTLPTTEIIHSQMRVCNRGVGLSLFELR